MYKYTKFIYTEWSHFINLIEVAMYNKFLISLAYLTLITTVLLGQNLDQKNHKVSLKTQVNYTVIKLKITLCNPRTGP